MKAAVANSIGLKTHTLPIFIGLSLMKAAVANSHMTVIDTEHPLIEQNTY